MRPKPTREWVMLELERLQVRKVSGRLGRKAEKVSSSSNNNNHNSNSDDGSEEDDDEEKKTDKNSNNPDLLKMSNHGGNSGLSSLDTIAEAALMNIGSSSSMSGLNGLNGDSKQMSQQQLGSNSNWLSGLTPGMGVQTYNSVGNALLNSDNPSQHYEMLKLHHMNLLNEIKETTFLMNLFKKHRLQKSVLQNPSGTPLLDLLRGTPRPSLQEQLQQIQQHQQQAQQQQGLLNLGIGSSGVNSMPMDNLLQQYSNTSDILSNTSPLHTQSSDGGLPSSPPSSSELEPSKSRDHHHHHGPSEDEQSLQKLKEEIAALQRKAQALETRKNSNDMNGDIRNYSQDRSYNKRKR